MIWEGDSRPRRGVAGLDLKVQLVTNQPAWLDKRSAGMDRNVVGDSGGMSKATRLQKSRLTKQLICEQTPLRRETRAEALERVKEHKRRRTKHSLRTPRSCCCMQKMCSQGHTRCVHLCKCGWMSKPAYVRVCLCVCVRGSCASTELLTLCPFILCGERSIIFTDLFNLASRREL